MTKVIIDTDPGIDDFMAIAAALESPHLDVAALTTIYGNVSVDQSTKNALSILNVCNSRVPVYRGAEAPLILSWSDFGGKIFHGDDGLGNLKLSLPPSNNLGLESAAAFIVSEAKRLPGKITLICLGPLTNIALALKIEPRLCQYIKQVIIMGGAVIANGNATPAAEFNILKDPHAADQVFTAGFKLTMVGLDVTQKVILDEAFFETLASGQKAFSALLSKSLLKYRDSYKNYVMDSGTFCHDPTAIAYAIAPEYFKVQSGATRVILDGPSMGQSLMDLRGKWELENAWTGIAPINAAIDVDVNRVKILLKNLLA